MLGGAQAAAAVCAETRDETDKANKEFDRWSDDDTPQVKATKEREFDAWSEESVEVEQEQKEDQELFFTDAAPDRSLGVSSKHRAPHPSHPSAPQPAEVEVRLSPRPPKAPPPAHLLQAEREAVEWLRKKAEVPVQPQPPAPAMPATVPRGRPVPPPPRLMRPMRPGPMQSAPRPVVQPVQHVPQMPQMRQMAGPAGQVPQTMQVPRVRQVAVTPVVLVPVSPCATWTCFFSLQHGLERMKLLGTLLLGDAATAQALVQDANANLKLSHRTSFEDVKKAALKALLQLVPMTDAKDQQARDSLEKYLLSKDRAGVVRVGMRDLYLIPPSKAEDCGLKVVPQAKCIVAAVAEKSRSKKSKSTAEVKKKAAEVVVADDTEDSEEPKNDKKVDNNRDKEDDQKNENKDGEAAVAEEKNKETKKEETTEDLKAAAPDEKKEAKPEAKQDKQDNESQASKVPHSPFESLKAQAKPQAKPRFSRLDVENAAFEIARSRDDRQVRPEPSTNRVPRGPPPPGCPGPGPWAFPEPWWNPYVSPPDHGAPERRRKRHRSSKERRRTRRRSKTKAGSEDSDTSSQSKSRPSEPAASHFRNPYIDPVPTEQPTETEENNSAEPVDEKWKGLLARVEALAEFCRADSVEDG